MNSSVFVTPPSPFMPLYIIGGIATLIATIVFIVTWGLPRFNGYLKARKFRLTIPDFNWKVVVPLDDYHNIIHIYLGESAAYFTVGKEIAANGIHGYTQFVLQGVNDDYDLNFKMGENVYLFWTEWQRFIKVIHENGGEVKITNKMSQLLPGLKARMESLDNLKLIEQQEKDK